MSDASALPRFSYVGPFRYFLTLSSHNRVAVFRSATTVDATLWEFLRTAGEERFAFLAYCFMPDRLHLLVEGTTDTSDLRSFMKLAMHRSAGAQARVHGTRLWQDVYHDRVLKRGEDARLVARYIIETPVRAGIVTTPTAYPCVGSAAWAVEDLIRARDASDQTDAATG